MSHYDSEAISRYVDRDMEAAERALLDRHFDECAECRRVRDELLALGDALRAYEGRPDRLAQRRALARILTGTEPRRGVTVPAPAFAGLVLALVAAVVAIAVLWPDVRSPADTAQRSAPPPAASAGIDLTRYDGGRRLAVFVVKHAPESGRENP